MNAIYLIVFSSALLAVSTFSIHEKDARQNDPHSCVGRCNFTLNSSYPCQCNSQCERFGDCCDDYFSRCRPKDVSDEQLQLFTEQLWTLEALGGNWAGHLINFNLQEKTTSGSSQDRSPLPLLTVDPAAYNKKTIAAMLPLLDNYFKDVGQNEVITQEELDEEKVFLDLIHETSLMKEVGRFLTDHGFVTDFVKEFYDIWFGLYSRETGRVGSSGFEHIMLGELKNGVSGFHGWVYFALEEAENRLNYNGWIAHQDLDFGGMTASMVSHNFHWGTAHKPISSMYIGTTPEFELGITTVCWYLRPNKRCNVSVGGKKFAIQTYDITYNGKKFVASGYPDV